jgi:tRNA(Ile)-lysidine synthase
MLIKLQNHIAQNFPFLMEKKLLIATSGGLDSMVLLHLFQQLGCEIAITHCNFQLRGLESFEDEKFVENYAIQNQIPIFIKQFDTEKYAKINKLSTQVAARELRYNWFYKMLINKDYDYILTAHHADDNLESFIINLSRGTGIEGLVGIPEQNDRVIRPLLIFSQTEIEEFANENGFIWREDSSNESDKYLRNKIRHNLIPVLKGLNPKLLDSFQKTQKNLQETQNLVQDAVKIMFDKVAKKVDNEIHFSIKTLKETSNYKSYLYQFLNKYGFSAWNDIYNLIESQSGKQVYSENFKLLKNRDFLILSPINLEIDTEEYLIENIENEVNHPIKLSFSKVNKVLIPSKETIYIDMDKLKFPLVIKRWKEGENFQPFGMNGKSKLVSKFFKDEKLSILKKKNVWLLYSDNQIVWIISYRQDERFKVGVNNKNILKVEVTIPF